MKTIHYSDQPEETDDEKRYRLAVKQVKKQKGFYIHLIVYIGVNIYLVLNDVLFGKMSWNNPVVYSTAFFWGIGLAAHGLSVFIPNFLFGRDWEKRKIKKYMDQR